MKPGFGVVRARVGRGPRHLGQRHGRRDGPVGLADRGRLRVGEDDARHGVVVGLARRRRGCSPRRRGPGTCRRRSAARCRSRRRSPRRRRRRASARRPRCPLRPGSMPTVSRPRPSTRGRRPVATSSRSPRSSRAVGELEHVLVAVARAPPAACWPRCSSIAVGARAPRRAPRRAARGSRGEQVVHALDERDRARPCRATAWPISTPTGPAAEDEQPPRDLASGRSPRGWSTRRRARAARGPAGSTGSEPVAITMCAAV